MSTTDAVTRYVTGRRGAADGEPGLLLTIEEVLDVTRLSRSTWLRGVATGLYPKPIRLSPRKLAWRSRDINELIRNPPRMPKARRAK